jgi:hypothetical protein
MTPDAPSLVAELARLLRDEPGFTGDADSGDLLVSGLLDRHHPMAWRRLDAFEAVEALTLFPALPAGPGELPPWRDPGWSVEWRDSPDGDVLTLWWHAAQGQAMLVSQIPFGDLRPDTVARTLRLHRDGLAACRLRARDSEAAPTHPPRGATWSQARVVYPGFA